MEPETCFWAHFVAHPPPLTPNRQYDTELTIKILNLKKFTIDILDFEKLTIKFWILKNILLDFKFSKIDYLI